MTDDLATWLQARYDEIEQVARAATSASGHWRWEHGMGDMCNDPECPYGELTEKPGPADPYTGFVLMQVHGYDVKQAWQGAEHIAMHDPAAVLRDVEAKRRIVEQARYAIDEATQHPEPPIGPVFEGRAALAESILRLLAQPVADRDDFREEWRL
jgi:hypothetical protein